MTKSAQAFAAPWGRTLRVMTLIVGMVCLALTVSLWPIIQREGPESIHFWGGLLPVVILLLAAVFTIKGYRLEGTELIVKRLFWDTRFSLAALESLQPASELMGSSRSLLGNNGFFGLMGLFKHPQLGAFRALVTDPARTMLLTFSDRKLAISPDDPERFIAAVLERNPTVSPPAEPWATGNLR